MYIALHLHTARQPHLLWLGIKRRTARQLTDWLTDWDPRLCVSYQSIALMLLYLHGKERGSSVKNAGWLKGPSPRSRHRPEDESGATTDLQKSFTSTHHLCSIRLFFFLSLSLVDFRTYINPDKKSWGKMTMITFLPSPFFRLFVRVLKCSPCGLFSYQCGKAKKNPIIVS